MSADDVINIIKKQYKMNLLQSAKDSTSFNYVLNTGMKVGFIASESKPFCGGCSRLRLGPKSDIRPCIMMSESYNIADYNSQNINQKLKEILLTKPIDRIESQSENMYQIGG